MQKSILSHIERANEIICKEGIISLIKKAWKIMSIRTYLDINITTLLSRFYTNGFHKLFYYSFFRKSELPNIYWMGNPIAKCPLDMWIYQEIIYKTKPEVIIETGTFRGGTTAFFAAIFDLMKTGQVITIDIENNCSISHPRITKIIGSSVSGEVINQAREIVNNKTAMVVLDSNHHKSHVLREMKLYSELVSIGNYLVVEDTNINGHPVLPEWGEGPMEAIEEFLHNRDDFEIDHTKEKFFLTCFPNGFLRRVKTSN